MWNELESYKNHYLQKELEHMKPIAISPLVQKDFQRRLSKRKKCKYPSEKAQVCEPSTYFDDHAQLAYGLWALPKLVRELCSDELKTQWRAINSLSEYLLNPINVQRAINDGEIVRILKNAFLRHRLRYLTQKYREIEKLLECFRIISIYYNGAKDIAKRTVLCDEFYNIILEQDKNADLASAILRNLSEKPDILNYMLENSDPYTHLSDIYNTDVCRPLYPYNLWVHLSHFLEIAPNIGIEKGFFEILHTRIVKKYPEYHCMTMKCFALIIRCAEGQRRFDSVDGVCLLYNIMSNEMELIPNFEYVVLAFLHGLQSKNAMRRCCDFVNLPKIMTKYALKRNHCNCRLQLYALKTLRQLGEMPCIKEYMRANCDKNIRSIICRNKENDCERQKLVCWLDREIWNTESCE